MEPPEESYLDTPDLEGYLTEHGYVPGAHFSGQFADLQGVPDDLGEGSTARGDSGRGEPEDEPEAPVEDALLREARGRVESAHGPDSRFQARSVTW